MTYVLKGTWLCDNQIFVPPTTFAKNNLVATADAPNVRSTWNKAADIYQFVDVPEVGKIINPKKLFLPINRPVELSFDKSNADYSIRLELPGWIRPTDVTLTIYENDMPTFSELTPTQVTNQTSNKLSTAIAASTTITTIAANPLRKGLVVRNRGNQTVYMGFNDPAITVATAAAGIVNGDAFEMLSNAWTGALHFITASGTANLVVTELF